MTAFHGFPSTSDATPLPNLVFSTLLEQVADLSELKCALRFFYLLHRKKGAIRYVTMSELLADPILSASMGGSRDAVHAATAALVQRCVLLRMMAEAKGGAEELFFLNTPREQKLVEQLQNGEAKLPQLTVLKAVEPPARRPSIFDLYETSIGRVITPLIGDELKDAEKEYPADWIEDSFKEAVRQNKRSWAYVSAILRRWKEEGRVDGTSGRRAQKVDPKDYLRGYGQVAKRRS